MEKLEATPTTITEQELREKVRHLIGSDTGPQFGAMFLLGVRMALVIEGRPLEKKFTQVQVKVILDGLLLTCLSIYKRIGDDIAAEMFKNPNKEVMQ